MKLFISTALVLLIFATIAISQTSIKPTITKNVGFEKTRNSPLEKAIVIAAGINSEDDRTTRYYYNYIDLNGDGVNEVLVYIFEGHFCGTGGCDAYLFVKKRSRYVLRNHFEPVRNPIIVSENKTKGWNDLIFFNSGGGIVPGYYSLVRFDGTTYPSNPTIEDQAPSLKKRVRGTAYLVGNGYGKSGIAFRFR